MDPVLEKPPYINELLVIPFQGEELSIPLAEVNYDSSPVIESSTAETLRFIESAKSIDTAIDTYPNDPIEFTVTAMTELPQVLSPEMEANLTTLLSGITSIDYRHEEPIRSESNIHSQRIAPLAEDSEVRTLSYNIATIGNFPDYNSPPESPEDESEFEDEDPRAFLPRIRSGRPRRSSA